MSAQLSFADYHGPDVKASDAVRFRGHTAKIYAALQTGGWFSLRELSALSGALETSVSARLREFKPPRCPGRIEKRETARRGLWLYRLVLERNAPC